MKRFFALGMTLILLSLLTACGGDSNKEQQKLNKNKALWEKQYIDDYAFDIAIGCFCGNMDTSFSVEVSGSEIKRYNNDKLRFEQGDDLSQEWVSSIPELFQFIDMLIGTVDEIEVEYHEQLGYPISISVDRYKDSVDDEFGISITRFIVAQDYGYVCEPVIEPTYRVTVLAQDSWQNISCAASAVIHSEDDSEELEIPESEDEQCQYNSRIISSYDAPLQGQLIISAAGYETLQVDISAKTMACGLSDATGRFYLTPQP
ncbi:DUF6174 domain-containing protein [Thalassotalea sp. ND16A]|uniref:DUF6174 domain-containing protein n=1 Tax=Thalassotalea sp. ND16A TaxID=1535422 RepID=UPI00051A6FD4|nr:DUF6174 domain-containing protein [Thalassotalea sp. ND16A]KGJ95751.1 hypothetical protein ND16A_1286 [Thalassotalea sp. ND16A]